MINIDSIYSGCMLRFPALFCQYLWQFTRPAWKHMKECNLYAIYIGRNQNSINTLAWIITPPLCIHHGWNGCQIIEFVSEIKKKSLYLEQKTAHCVRLVGNVRPMMRNPIVKWKRGIYISSSNGLAKYAHEMAHAFIYYPSQTRTFFFASCSLQSSLSVSIFKVAQCFRIKLKKF